MDASLYSHELTIDFFIDQIALLGVFSLVVLIQSSVNCAEGDYPCTEVNGFAVAAGTISLAICLAYFFLQAWGQAEEIHKFYLSVFLFIWYVDYCFVTKNEN